MKTAILVSMMCCSLMTGFAQTNNSTILKDQNDNTDQNMNTNDRATERQAIRDRAESIYQRTHGNMGRSTRMPFKTAYSRVHAAYPDAPANAVPAKPSGEYTALQDPPCYKYKNAKSHEVMECPGAQFGPENSPLTEPTTNVYENGTNLSVNHSRSYTGNYPDLHRLYPDAPRNATPAYPKSHYTELQDPPCYKYVNRRGLKVMECPGAQFDPEHEYR